MCLGHVYIVLEPVGSARLMFDDDWYYEFMCFNVPKVVRSPGRDHGHDKKFQMVETLRSIYWKAMFGHQKGSG